MKEWGRSPNKLVVPINKISVTSIRDQERPLELWIGIICFNTNLINHCWIVIIRLLISRLGLGYKIVGNKMIKVTIGIPISVGVMKGVNKFSFIFLLKAYYILFVLERLFEV